MIQIGLLAKCLLEVAQQRKGIGSIRLLGKLKDALKLDAQAREIQAVQACAQTRITQVLIYVSIGNFLLSYETGLRQLRFCVSAVAPGGRI